MLRGKIKSTSKKSVFKKQRLKLFLGYGLVFSFFAIIGAILSLNMLFKVRSIEVIGYVPYSEEEILDSSKIKNGDNLFLIKSNSVKNKIEKSLPYVKNANVKKVFPNKCIIEVEPVQKVLAFSSNDRFALVDDKGKLLEISESIPENAIIVNGVNVDSLDIGSNIKYKDNDIGERFEKIVRSLNLRDLNKITSMDFSNPAKIVVTYENRVDINFGGFDAIDYKVRTAKEILSNKIGSEDKGTLDLSTVSKDNRSYFKPKN